VNEDVNVDNRADAAIPWLVVPQERREQLASKLEALLADFSKLAEVEPADTEPVSSEWLMRSAGRDRR
jgi:Asp-tRNA(Asn)/Glu-tRNA(Gln) amidotransferase C subunit